MYIIPLSYVLLGFDFISKYGLDTETPPGVRVVEGSNYLQTAYKITKKAEFRIPTR